MGDWIVAQGLRGRRGRGALSSPSGLEAHVGEGELLAIAVGELPGPVTWATVAGVEKAEPARPLRPDRDPPAASDTGADAMVLPRDPASLATPAVGAGRSPGEAIDAGVDADRRVLVAAGAQPGAVVVGDRPARPTRWWGDRPAGRAGVAVVGLGDPARPAIVRRLAVGSARVIDLVAPVGLAQSKVSKHLACLRDCGLVISEPVGRASMFSLAQPALADMIAAEVVLGATGNAVALCPAYGVETCEQGPS
jgi:ArsR family transcriptional regulator, cadmium/lead-responsive transcriptional repressor